MPLRCKLTLFLTSPLPNTTSNDSNSADGIIPSDSSSTYDQGSGSDKTVRADGDAHAHAALQQQQAHAASSSNNNSNISEAGITPNTHTNTSRDSLHEHLAYAVCGAARPSISPTDKRGVSTVDVHITPSRRVVHVLLPHSLPASSDGVYTYAQQFVNQGIAGSGSLFMTDVLSGRLFAVDARLVLCAGASPHESSHALEYATSAGTTQIQDSHLVYNSHVESSMIYVGRVQLPGWEVWGNTSCMPGADADGSLTEECANERKVKTKSQSRRGSDSFGKKSKNKDSACEVHACQLAGNSMTCDELARNFVNRGGGACERVLVQLKMACGVQEEVGWCLLWCLFICV
jgi:hypothetical protein